MNGYEPYSSDLELANIELDKADDIEYIIKYWRAIGTLPLPGVPFTEKLASWEEGLELN